MVWPNSLTSFTLKKYSLCLGLDFQILPEGAGSAAEMAGPGQRVGEHVRLETHAPSNGRHPRTERRRWVSARPATRASPPQPSVMLERRGQNREVPAGPSPGRELTRALGARRPTPTAVRSRRHPRHPSAWRKRLLCPAAKLSAAGDGRTDTWVSWEMQWEVAHPQKTSLPNTAPGT